MRNDVTAAKARSMSMRHPVAYKESRKPTNREILNEVLDGIMAAAIFQENVFVWSKPLPDPVKTEIKKRGFTVTKIDEYNIEISWA